MKDGLKELCGDLPPNLVGLEIGSFAGESARIFAESGKFRTLYCVDPWNVPGWNEDLTGAEKEFDKVASEFKGMIVKKKGVLAHFTKDLPLVDFVYVDSGHTFAEVSRDIYQARMFSHRGTIFAGHDYCERWDGVQKAVKMCFPREKVKVYADTSWKIDSSDLHYNPDLS
jgi:hypothetical protein